MCGILFSLACDGRCVDRNEWETLKELNTRRGPDSQKLHQLTVNANDQHNFDLQFYSTVLHLRGPDVVPQPRVNDESGNILCWNGEIFGGLNVEFGQNDTEVLMDGLEQAATETQILATFQKIEGPFAFVYYRAESNKVYFSRDCLGRRSLLWYKSENGPFMLSSVGMAPKPDDSSEGVWEEVPANGIYCIDLNKDNSVENSKDIPKACGLPISVFPWLQGDDSDKDKMLESGQLKLPFPKLNATIPDLETIENENMDIEPLIAADMQKSIEEFMSVLSESVKKRVADIPHLNSKGQARVAILFSGGLDCICLAALANKYLPMEESIDLLNVAFENPRVEKAKAAPVKKPKNKKKKNKNAEDSTETKVEEKPVIAPTKSIYDTPDRITGKDGVEELRRIAPDRKWNFVEINVPYPEALEYRQRIVDRMFPLDTVMDLSIAMAFWFASRGKGVITENGEIKEYESHARVLISGLGADEQLGGYSRHREAFRKGSWEKLIEETQLDVDRISSRNLGRDDRIMSDHGKEVRFPFLSTDVVNWLCQQPIQLKMDLRYNRGIGEKILLRHVARVLGLTNASRNWKRAIQFGAKTAKMTNETRSEKGQHKLSQE